MYPMPTRTPKLPTKVPKASPRPDVSHVRFNQQDWEVIERLRKKTGILSIAELLRKALRDSAAKEKL